VLLELRIENLGIIEELGIVVPPGLSVITGETGAGKTLVVGALELLAGARADAMLVRPGAAEARVEGRFEDPMTGEEVVVARVLPAEGRSRAYVDGRMATVAELADLGARLIDLHGQHAHQSLLAPAMQRAVLDTFAGPPALEPRAEYQAAREELRAVDRALDDLGGDERTRARELSLLNYQIDEIEAAGLSDADEMAALERQEAALAGAEEDRAALLAAHEAVDGRAVDSVGVAAAALGARATQPELTERVKALQAELSEAAHDLRVAAEAVVEDPERLEAVRERRRLLRDLQKKYGDTIAEVIAHRDEASARVAELESHEERTAALEADRRRIEEQARAAADRLHDARVAAAGALADAVQARLQRLAMPKAQLTVEVEAAEPGEDGADRVVFLLAANAGEPAQPLAKVASGGELSRAMLGLRVALAERGDPGRGPVLVFDEVDAGIGGEAGAAVGRELKALAAGAQVLCITHLAQVAACADAQIVVRKAEHAGRTTATARAVLHEDRVAELSRMLAGVEDSAHARRHAEELLSEGSGAGAPTTTRTRPASKATAKQTAKAKAKGRAR
jgi:DNA repair protein RecN (Recombination protein N)